MAKQQRKYVQVWLKTKWSDPWYLRNDFRPISASLAASPSVGKADFIIEYGRGQYEDGSAMRDGSLIQSRCRQYVQITSSDVPDPDYTEITALWTGVIPAEQFVLKGQTDRARTADQKIMAYSIEKLLDTRLNGAIVSRDGIVDYIDVMPAFNQKTRSGDILGNRSGSKKEFPLPRGLTVETYLFGDNDIWNNWDIIEYLTGHYQVDPDKGGPRFYLDVEYNIIQLLKQIEDVYKFDGMSLRQALNQLISRTRGLGWSVNWSVGNEYDKYGTLKIWSLLDEELTIGDITIPAHKISDRITIPLWTDPGYIQTDITQDVAQQYDKIIVRGGRIKTAGTFKVSDDELEKSWTQTEETAYKDAAKNVTGYGSLSSDEQAELNDSYRSVDRFARVFSHFTVPLDWDWTLLDRSNDSTTYTRHANPRFDFEEGDWQKVEGDFIAGPYWNNLNRFLPQLPFKEGIDYSGSAPDNKNPSGVKPDFRKMFALTKDAGSKYRFIEKLAGSIRPLQDDLGVEVRFRPQYLFAKNDFSGAEPYKVEDLSADGYDFDDLIVTAMLETWQYFQLQYTLEETETDKTLLINVPDAELWYVTEGTVIDVDDNGELIYYGGPREIRNDIDRLRSIMAAALAWYSKKRNKLTVTVASLGRLAQMGQMIMDVDVGGGQAGSCVSAIIMDFNKQTTTYKTDYFELDLRNLGRVSSTGSINIPNLKAAAVKINQLESQQQQIQQEINKQPVRIEPGGGTGTVGTINGPYIFKITSVGTNGKYTCRMYQVDSSAWVSDLANKLIQVSETNYTVWNLTEQGFTSAQWKIAEYILGWKLTDDEGNTRYVGHSVQFTLWSAT